jgi:nucleotide-binding universal stress UspA family protein
MDMYSRILVPVDGSSAAKGGLREAIKIAKEHHGVIRLIHVVIEVIPPREGFDAGGVWAELRERGEEVLRESRELVLKEHIEVESRLVERTTGYAGDAVIEDAGEWPADLIVIGTHGRRGLRRLLLGSDAEDIVRMTPVPVLLVRDQSDK